jgi:hypothetical protein
VDADAILGGGAPAGDAVKLLIGCPSATGSAVLPLTASLLELQSECFDHGIRFVRPAIGMQALLPQIRDAIVDDFRGSDADMLLQVDADQSFEPADFFALLAPIEKGYADVCGASVGLKAHDPQRIRQAALMYQSDLLKFAVGGSNVQPVPGQAFRMGKNFYVPARVGTGMMLMTKHAVVLATRMAKVHYESVDPEGNPAQPIPMLFDGIAEDLGFCDKVLGAGGKVVAHLNSNVLHWGMTAFQNNGMQLASERGMGIPDFETRT